MERLQVGLLVGGALFDLDLHCRWIELANSGAQRFFVIGFCSVSSELERSNHADQISEREKTAKGHKQSAHKDQCFVVHKFSNFIQCHEWVHLRSFELSWLAERLGQGSWWTIVFEKGEQAMLKKILCLRWPLWPFFLRFTSWVSLSDCLYTLMAGLILDPHLGAHSCVPILRAKTNQWLQVHLLSTGLYTQEQINSMTPKEVEMNWLNSRNNFWPPPLQTSEVVHPGDTEVCASLLDLSGVISAQIAAVKLIENPKQASHDPHNKEQRCSVHFFSFNKVTQMIIAKF